jgi:hypothetical protein
MEVMNMRRYNRRGSREDHDLLELASTFTVVIPIANINAADIPAGWAKYDAEFVGGYVEIDSDDDGDITLEKWDDPAGSAQTAMSAVCSIDGGVDLHGEIVPVATTDRFIAAGEKFNILSATFDGSKTGVVILYFRHVEETW